MSGLTTMLGGGTGPRARHARHHLHPRPWHIARMIEAADAFPMNLAFAGKGNASLPGALIEMVLGGATSRSCTRTGARRRPPSIAAVGRRRVDVQVMIHTDTLNESGFVEDSIAALKGRTIHAFHTKGRRRPCALISSRSAVSERHPVLDQSDPALHDQHARRTPRHADVCHHLSPSIPEDIAFAESPSQGNDRRGRHSPRYRRLLDHLLRQPGHGPRRRGGDPHLADGGQDETPARPAAGRNGDNDNLRVKRYIAKYTINPAIAHG